MTRTDPPHHRYKFPSPFAAAIAVLVFASLCGEAPLAAGAISSATDAGGPPLRLRDTGLFAAGSSSDLHPDVLTFTPQYPLWSDGAAKRRWLYLPPGTYIDASSPDVWEFPIGTKFWKAFSHGRTIETRYIERRADGEWQYATYVWNEDGRDAVLAPSRGARGLAVGDAPNGRYDIPSRGDCTACHEGAAAPVLGFSALQLSPARDPHAVHGGEHGANDVDLPSLVARGRVRNLPAAYLDKPPVIAAANPVERAAMGYLHGNCGHCHNDNGSPAPVNLVLAQRVDDAAASRRRVMQSAVNMPSRFRFAGAPGTPSPTPIIAPARPDESVLVQRMRSRHAATQMPPLGTSTVDSGGLALVERWISQLNPHKEQTP